MPYSAAVILLLVIAVQGAPQKSDPTAVKVNKCCESWEVVVDGMCVHVNQSGIAGIGEYIAKGFVIEKCLN